MTTKLPKAIQKQVDEAAALEREMYGDPAAAAPGAGDTAQEAPAQADKAALEGKTDDTSETSERADAPATPPAKESAPKDGDPSWEARYKTLHGKYQAEVPALHQKVRDLAGALEQLREAQQRQPEKPSEAPKPIVTDDDVEAFGADLVDLVRRIAKSEVSGVLPMIEAEAATIKADMSRVQERVVKTDYDRFIDKVNRLVPNFDEVNTSPEWLEWLGAADPLLGMTRKQALDMAARAQDVSRTVAFFQAFEASRPKAPAPKRSTAMEDARIEPRSQTAAPAQSTGNKRYYTEAEVSRMLDPRYLRTLSDEKARQVEAEIDMASAEGRIL